MLLPSVALAAAGTSYQALSISGAESPPDYGLRLDGFFDGNAATEVTFHFDDVFFDQYADGTALLRGEITVAEHNTTGAPGSQNVGPGSHGTERYLLSVHFIEITDPAKIALIENYRSDWLYYDLDPLGVEIQRIGSASDSTHLWMYPDDFHKPFQVGYGANGKNDHFGAAGWLSYKHYKNGKIYGGGPGTYLDASDFLMDLVPSEPQICDSIRTVDNFTMAFLGVTYDYTAGSSRWEYELTWDGSPPDLSQLTIELCKELTPDNLLAAIPSNGAIGRDGSTGLYGIKWDPPPFMPAGVPVRFSFTLNRLLAVDEAGFFPKAAINQNYAQICGPALDCREITPPCEVNLRPTVQAPPIPDPIRCVPEDGRICIPGWLVSDPEGDPLTFGTMGSGTYDPETGTFCKVVDVPGQYTMTLAVTDACGGTSTASLTFEVAGNLPPVVELSSGPVDLCATDTVCLDLTAQDEQPSTLAFTTNLGWLDGSAVCFLPDSSGLYTVIVTATDDCGLQSADTVAVQVGLNEPPTIVLSCPGGPGAASSTSFLLPGRESETVSICEGDTLACLNCRLFVDDPDGDPVEISVPEGVVWNPDNGTLCLVRPTQGEHMLVFTATDSCQAVSAETLLVNVVAGTPPALEFSSPDTALYVCDADTLLCFSVWATGSEPVQIEEVLNPGTFNAETGEFCFNPSAICFGCTHSLDTTICIVFRASNGCGEILDSLCVTLFSRPPPEVALPEVEPVLLCEPGEICVGPVTILEPSGAPLDIVGIGAEYRDGQLCFTPAEPGSYYVGVAVTDACGRELRDSVRVLVGFNTPPQITGPDVVSSGVCGPEQVCVGPFGISDPDLDPVTVTVSGGASLDGEGRLCFSAPETGRYEFVITASDSCGSSTHEVAVEVVANRPPEWSRVPDTVVAQCGPGDSVCIVFGATDPDSDPITYQAALIPYEPQDAVPGSTFCFVPSEAGEYLVAVWAADSCNEPILDTARVVVVTNAPPVISFSLPDTVLFLCNPDTLICFQISATDLDGDSVTLREILNPGTFDGTTGEVCFNPDSVCFADGSTSDTTICLIFGASDECAPEQVDTLCIRIVANRAPVVTLPAGAPVSLCGPGQICLPGVTVTDPDGDDLEVTVSSGGAWQPGSVCFPATEPGRYTLVVCATDPCGRSACDTAVVDVSLNSGPVVTFGPDTTVALCAPGPICLPMPSVTDADGDIPLLQIEGASQSGDQLCFQATSAGTRIIVVRATDSCGATGLDTLRVSVRVNAAPRVLIRAAQPLTLCDIDTTLCFGVMVSDLDGSPLASLQLIKTDTRFWSLSGTNLCLNAAVALAGRTQGTFQAIVEATDACGAKGRDTLTFVLKANQPPQVALPADTSVTLCEPGEVCLGPVTFGDPDGGLPQVEVQGAVLVDDRLCFDVAGDSLVQIMVTALDSCGATTTDTLRVTTHINRAPSLNLPSFQTLSVCAFDTLCVDGIFGADPDRGLIPAELISGPGAFDPESGRLCFAPEADGTYEFTFSASDECVTVTETWTLEVTTNARPAFAVVPDTSTFVCERSATLCLDFVATDPEGDPIRYSLLAGAGQINPETGRLCFAADTSGTYTFSVTASDSCGASQPVTGTAVVRVNAAPVLAFSSSDTTLYLCDPDTLVCFTVTASDADGPAPQLSEILNPGSFDPLTGQFCFNPDSVCFQDDRTRDTTICIVFEAVDSCGSRTVDSLCVRVVRNLAPEVDLGPDQSQSLCEPGRLCVDLSEAITDPDGGPLTITVQEPAVLDGAEACIDVTQSGPVTLVVCATDSCGLSSCDTLQIDVFLNSPPVVELPADTAVVACVVGEICLGPVFVGDPDFSDSLTVTLSGGATLVNNRLCFVPPGDGDYLFVVTATDRCGAVAVDSVTVTVDANSPPVLAFSSPDTSLTLCHSDTELCYQVVATDPDGELPTLEEILVPGFFDPSTGTFCFNPDSVCFGGFDRDTTVCVVFKATDACGASVIDSLCIELRVNRPPAIVFSSPDTTLYVCRADTLLCFGVTAVDEEGDSVQIREIVNPGEYYPELGQFCFRPSSVCYPNTPCAEPPTCIVFEAEDECGNVTRDSLCIEVFANVPPTVVAPESVTVIQCDPGDEVCVSPVYGFDVEEGELPVEAAGATYNPLLKSLCFVADTAGVYRLVVATVDGCQLTDTAEIWVQVLPNQPPQVALPADTTLFQCEADSVCLPVVVSDAENNWSVAAVTGPARFDSASATLCVAVTSSEPFTVGLEIVDHCGRRASDQIVITPRVNRPPVVQLPPDFTAPACQPGPFCFGPVVLSDPDANLAGPPVVTGGTYDPVTGQCCIDVTSGGLYTLIVSVTDSCGATAADTVVVNVPLNQPPVTSFSSPDTSLFLCSADTTLCFNFSATDPDGGLVLLNEILNPGTFDPLTGDFCFNPSDICYPGPENFKCAVKRTTYDTTICLIFSATDTCGAEVWDTLCVHVTANDAPVVLAPPDTTIYACGQGTYCLSPFQVSDPNGPTDTLVITTSGPAHTFDTATGVICFVAGPGTYTFVVTAEDRCARLSGDTVVVTVAPNAPPSVQLVPESPAVTCGGQEVCVPVTATDPDPGDLPQIAALLPFTRYDAGTSRICFTPDTAGSYRVIARATDRCGLEAFDTLLVPVVLNRPPVWVTVPQIDTFFCAPPGLVCFTVVATDPDQQSLVYSKLQGPGQIDSLTGRICFNPGTTSGLHTFVVRVRDLCGASVLDTASVNVRINRAPVLPSVRDTLLTLCQSRAVCFPPIVATDPDGNSVTYSVLSGTGTIQSGIYCFTPDTSGFYAIRIRASDPCGLADTVQFHASVRLNAAPVLTLPQPTTIFQCASGEICRSGITATDVDGGPVTIVKTAGPGTFNAAQGRLCFTPTAAGTYHFDFAATDSCGAQTTGRMTITVLQNRAPSLDVPDRVSVCRDSQVCLNVGGIDPDIGNRLTITQVSGPAGTFSPSPLAGPAPLSGQWCWQPQAAGSYLAVFQVTDSCGATALDTTRIDVSEFCDTLCFAATIPNICPEVGHPDRWLFQGRTHQFPVMVTPSRDVGAFDFLIGYDASALTVQNVVKGTDISAWEFFTYRLVNPNSECSGVCPSGLLRIVGIADINNGVPISNPSQTQPSSQPREYARITFQVSNDRTLGGQYVEVDFHWNDCGDNTFSSPLGDLYVASAIDPDTCVGAGAKEQIEACASFQGGGGCIPTAADIDDRGDLNLNGIAYEISDAVLYSNYHIFGPQVFDPDPIRQASQVAASDVNADGTPLTVADLVFLIRVIVGLQEPIDEGLLRPAPPSSVTLSWGYRDDNLQLELEGVARTGALALEVRVQRAPESVELSPAAKAAGMELLWHADGDRLRMLVYSMTAQSLPAGMQSVLVVRGAGSVETISIQASDHLGAVATVHEKAPAALPLVFDLDPNYPNPFNPETQIRFTLHQPATVTLTIFNVLGQEVARLADLQSLPAGPHTYRWLARDARGTALASGVYMYRLSANGHSETRKMLLLR